MAWDDHEGGPIAGLYELLVSEIGRLEALIAPASVAAGQYRNAVSGQYESGETHGATTSSAHGYESEGVTGYAAVDAAASGPTGE